MRKIIILALSVLTVLALAGIACAQPEAAEAAGGARETGGDRLTVEVGPTNNITTVYCG